MRVTSDYNLGKLHPDLAREWHTTKNGKLTPYDVLSGSARKVWWFCSKGHEWEESLNNRTSHGRECPYCSGQRVSKDYNLSVKFPELAKQWHPTKNGGLTPYDVMPGGARKVWWKCDHGHEWEASLYHRTGGRNCPFCYKEKTRSHI